MIALLFIQLITVTVGLFVAVIGFVWSPFAAAIGAVVAYRRQENVLRAASTSAFYSFLSIILWVFFVLDLADVNVSKKIVSVVQCVAYGYWFVALIHFGTFNFEVIEISGVSESIVFVTLLIGIGTWIVGVSRKFNAEEATDCERFPRTVLVAPFVFSMLWSCIYLFRAITFEEMDWAVWFLILPNAGSTIWVFWSWSDGGFRRIENPWIGGTV